MSFEVTIRWGHLDRMPLCQHGRAICAECEAVAAGRCRWCDQAVIRGVPCGCPRAQEEARRIMAARP